MLLFIIDALLVLKMDILTLLTFVADLCKPGLLTQTGELGTLYTRRCSIPALYRAKRFSHHTVLLWFLLENQREMPPKLMCVGRREICKSYLRG